ncbi:hormogonium polysaccharide secretion pseudopilin HpsC [Anabaena catenula]|uniref:Prepilin-type N-terminal cleavage/methylation domain-containing protein n=1 Tax=Anabaena catenula FACHB-362 TaxID=2692877 RepID=A0ABR8J5Q7_9NOST|nr:hormogonium polysaccharide secretion pseudopilin HpsC [Anabaena catenula]MBD2693194.1 prepilin-type N-terminal cleavage/methylation domain-containing protein [Anabaena catenula FACHB-362]
MFKTITFLLRGFIKSPRVNNQVDGFTLIELLIALTMAFLILTPLLGLVVNIANTDQKEQAKATSEQEIQTAMDFITRDLQQAVYIYDDRGVEKTNNTTFPLESGIKDSLPVVPNGLPVLVFWKREIVPNAVPNDGASKDDAFRYSLVAYYLINNSNNIDPTWSKTARIARWEIKDGVRSINSAGGTSGCNYKYDTTTKFISLEYCPDPGFKPFDLDSTTGSITQKMKLWKGDTTKYTTTPQVLIDYIDQTIPNPNPTGNIPNLTRKCLTDANIPIANTSKQPKVIPSNTTSPSSFYACVSNYIDPINTGQVTTTAQVFIRANALARVQGSNTTYTDKNQATYFPSVNTIVQARGFLYTN